MKLLIKFLTNSTVYIIFIILLLFTLCNNHKFFHTYFIISPFATYLIWTLNWDYYKLVAAKAEIKLSFITYVAMYVVDMITWPLALIQTSKIILVDEIGEENV